MRKTVKLTERDLTRLVNKVLNEVQINESFSENNNKNEKIKELVFHYLYSAVGGSKIYHFNDTYYLVDKNKIYLELTFTKTIVVLSSFFDEIRTVFQINPNILKNIMKQWVEIIFKVKPRKIHLYPSLGFPEEVINNGKEIKTL